MVDIVVVGKVSVIEEKVMPIGYLLEPVHVLSDLKTRLGIKSPTLQI